MVKYNWRGHPLKNDEIKIVINMEWLGKDGSPDFQKFMENGDKDGFLIAGPSYRKKITLPPQKRIVRYGHPNGNFTADVGCEYEKLGLPYYKDSMEYHEYIVMEATEVECVVEKGIVAPCFDSPGGEIQYYHHKSINELLTEGVLVEDYEWLKKILQSK